MAERTVRSLPRVLCVICALAAGGCGGGSGGSNGTLNVTADDGGSADAAVAPPDAGTDELTVSVPPPTPPKFSGSSDAGASTVPAGTGAGRPSATLGASGPSSVQPRDAAIDLPIVFDAAREVALDAAPRDASATDVPVERFVFDAGAGDVVPRDAPLELASQPALQTCGRIRCDCTLRGVRLWGNVAYVTSGATFKIAATGPPDLFVQASFVGTSCGMWAEVLQPQAADFTVELVTSGEDFQIQFSEVPGVAKPPGAP